MLQEGTRTQHQSEGSDASWERADVVVIGGGPAGSATALRLARRGFQVVQIEQRHFLRPGTDDFRSGEALIPRTRRELAVLGIPMLEAAWACAPIQQVRMHWPSGAQTSDSMRRHGGLLQINREAFDAQLWAEARRAGVDNRQGWRACGFHRKTAGHIAGVIVQPPDRSELHGISAPVVVDAGGRNALTIRELGVRLVATDGDFFGMALFFDQVDGLVDRVAEVHLFDPHDPTILLLSRIQDGIVRCGLGTSFQFKRAAEGSLQAFFWSRLQQIPELAQRFRRSRSIRSPFARSGIGYRVRQVVFDGLVLVGDAAGYPTPLFGDGIFRALRSAQQAAATIEQAAQLRNYSAAGLSAYARWHAVVDRSDRIAHAIIRRAYQHPHALQRLAQLTTIRQLLFMSLLRG